VAIGFSATIEKIIGIVMILLDNTPYDGTTYPPKPSYIQAELSTTTRSRSVLFLEFVHLGIVNSSIQAELSTTTRSRSVLFLEFVHLGIVNSSIQVELSTTTRSRSVLILEFVHLGIVNSSTEIERLCVVTFNLKSYHPL
jgi:hypothetical protein